MATLSFAALSGAVTAQEGPAWKAGAAAVDITPSEPMWLAGYASRDHTAEGVLQPLWAKALAVEDAQGRRAILITSDLLGFPKEMSDHIRDRIQQRFGLTRADILLNSSHTHSGPVLLNSLMGMYPLDEAGIDAVKKYSAALEEKAAALAEQAFANLQPARLASGKGVVRFAVNRRENSESELLNLTEFKGPVDHSVPVVMATKEDGAPLAIVFSYACHGTVLCEYQWCGDYPGFAQAALEKAYPGAVAMFAAGCGADINPLPRRTAALARQYGAELAAATQRAITDTLKPLDPVLTTRYNEVDLELAPAPDRAYFEGIARDGAPYMRKTAAGMVQELDAGRPLRSHYPYCIQIWRLGGQTLVAMGGETVVEYDIAVKRMLGPETAVFGYSNDVMSYIPSLRVLREGRYEGDTSQLLYGMPSKWAESIETRILDGIRTLATDAGLTPAP